MTGKIEDQILFALHKSLGVAGNPLVVDDFIRDELDVQVRSIIRDTLNSLPEVFGACSESNHADIETKPSVGKRRAQQGIHPAESLAAANLLYRIALIQILDSVTSDTSERAMAERIAIALHKSITSVVVPASVDYVNVLLERLSVAHRDERFEISRELHDRVAHGIASTLQRLTLLEQLDEEHPPETRSLIVSIRSLLEETLGETRSIAKELRQFVGDKTLYSAIKDYVQELPADPIRITLHESGAPHELTSGIKEEVFLVVRELVTNARQHSHGSEIQVRFDWVDGSVTVSVTDNGTGFDQTAIRVGAMGLVSTRERSEIIDGTLLIKTETTGTTVSLSLYDRTIRR